MISAAEVHIVRSREMLIKFHMLVYLCGFHYCIQTSNHILVPVLCVVVPGVGGDLLQVLQKHVGVNKKFIVVYVRCTYVDFMNENLGHNARNDNVQNSKICYSAYLQSQLI